MKAESKLALFRGRLKHLTYRALTRLGVFHFPVLYMLVNVALKKSELRRGRGLVRVGVVTGEVLSLPRDVMLWLGRVALGPPGHQLDVCLLLPRNADDANLHDLFSVALTFPGIRSVGLYWDSSSLADDLPLLQSVQDRSDPALTATFYEQISPQGRTPVVELLNAKHGELALPVAAVRDAQTLLKRQAGGAYAVCLNVPVELSGLVDAVAVARPDVRLFHFSPTLPETAGAANIQSYFGCGFTLHERMALVQAADAYVGTLDELGCTALISRRPAILLGAGATAAPEAVNRGDVVLWFPSQPEPAALTQAVLEFLSAHFAVRETTHASALPAR